jgi:selenide, water dikinase
LTVRQDDRVLVDYRTADDAGVYRIDEERALVQTVDFFTPIVDDAYTFGRIAAANALSDVYAMGGRPLTALAVAGFPAKDFDQALIRDVFRGGLDTLTEAGVALLGGHTVQDTEVKFGYAVTGLVHPGRILTNAGARAGDALVLTKPIGTGVIATAIKGGRAPEAAAAAAIEVMTSLNRDAGEAAAERAGRSVHASTDITGFGLIGHACEMALASGVTLEIEVTSVPFVAGAAELAMRNRAGGLLANQEHFGGRVLETAAPPDEARALLYDPQTSGGLLIAVEERDALALLDALRARRVAATRIGQVVERAAHAIRLL